MTTVKELIGYLQAIADQDQPVFYQYLTADDTDYSVEEFGERIEAVEFVAADGLSDLMNTILDAAELPTEVASR